MIKNTLAAVIATAPLPGSGAPSSTDGVLVAALSLPGIACARPWPRLTGRAQSVV
ncbi:hypothetical protein C4K04_3223 [Pseudomonas chlororaphis]|uniref:Uncharacterized protein n=1 Tax=Pseudomonas chlororaphis TaxID=587753 RepID=A0A3G7TP36_9PSED|nr:hypothetical protein C4K04_3223 [Pseudomonas chlororaphis]